MSQDHPESLTKELSENSACYVLLTCSPPTDEGQMEVKMTYEGDPILASYLLKGAQELIDQDLECDADESEPEATLRLVK